MLCRSSKMKMALGMGVFTMFALSPLCSAQDRDGDRDRNWDRDRGMYTRLEPGMEVPVKLNQTINVERSDNRVYYGIVDRDIRGDNGRIAIPRGANAELMVRVARDNDLILDLESVVVNGQRYAVRTNPDRVESQPTVVGAIVGAVSGGEVRGRVVRIPRDSVVTFRLEQPLEVGVSDRGVDRDGNHYHDWYDRGH